MARPAGYSSEEDDYLDDYYAESKDKNKYEPIQYTEAELKERKLHQLFSSILNGYEDEVLEILQDDIAVDVRLYDGWTPLMLAASVGNVKISTELINMKADINADKEQYTVLMAACACPESTVSFNDSFKVAKLLIDNGAKVDAETRRRTTPLMYAAKAGNLSTVNLLIPLCNKNAKDNQGWTALFWAVTENKPDVVKRLLEEGLTTEKVDIRNNTPANYAINNEYNEIIKLLPIKKQRDVKYLEETCYSLENIFEENMPQFQRDISFMLYGMKCECLINLFQNKKVYLANFLSITNSDLIELGVRIPYQRERILKGIYKFHRHPFKKNSLPLIEKNLPYSTLDISKSIIASVRQLTVMQASLKYLALNINVEEKHTFDKEIKGIRAKLLGFKATCKDLEKLAYDWDEFNKPADLILNDSIRKESCLIKWGTALSFCTLSVIIICKCL